MAGTWPKVIRDPVHELIPFEDTPCDRLLWDLINTREFQRLRRIKQLGVCEIVFPGANHSRFSHSIGVMHIARSFLARVRRVWPGILDEERETLVLVAALVHDVGHGPFSHSFETITGDRHESRTLEIVLDQSTEIHQCLASYRHCAGLARKLSFFFGENAANDGPLGAEFPSFLTQIVSSQLDADRFDYLQRDSHATGADYGRFDWKWLIHNLNLDHEKGRFYLDRKALAEAERYVFARYHMYRTVYFHKTSRAAEVMLRLIFKRFKQFVDLEGPTADVQALVPGMPESVLTAFSGRPPLAVYLALDDHAMTELFKACARGNDPLLKELGAGLLNRKLYKAVDVTFASPRRPLILRSPLSKRSGAWGSIRHMPLSVIVPRILPTSPMARMTRIRSTRSWWSCLRVVRRKSARRRAASIRFKTNTACCDIISPAGSEMS